MTWFQALVPAVFTMALVTCLRVAFDYRQLAVRSIVLVSVWLLEVRYFYWRASNTLPDGPAWLVALASSILLLELSSRLLAELYYARAARHYVDRSAEADAHAGWWTDKPPLVDLFIPTYNESEHVLTKTLAGARYQDYPNVRVWVLDDGKRDWLQRLCELRGVRYLRRPDNHNYKSGNLNHALAHVRQRVPSPDFIAVLDADFVAKPSFVSRCMALMHDPKTSLVQTPQEFFNPDPIQYAFGSQNAWPDDLRFLFSVELRGLDGLGNSSCCGTSFLVRREALDAIGGFATESVAEDLLTAVKLGHAGLRCVYLKEHLSTGLAAEGLLEHLNQRSRWVHGLVEVGRSAWSPAAGARWPLSWFHFANFSLRKGVGLFSRHVLLWIPIFTWWTGYSVYEASVPDAVYWILPLIAARWALVWLEQGATLPVVSDVTTLLPSLSIVRSTVSSWLLTSKLPFVVTEKGTQRHRVTVHWRLLIYFGGVALLTLLGLAGHALWREPISSSGPLGYMVLWSAYDILVCGLALVPCFERPKYRASERFATQEAGSVHLHGRRYPCQLVNISTSGAALECAVIDPPLEGAVAVEVMGCPTLPARVIRKTSSGHLGVEFQPGEAASDALIRKLYCSNGYIHPGQAWSARRACLVLMHCALGRASRG